MGYMFAGTCIIHLICFAVSCYLICDMSLYTAGLCTPLHDLYCAMP